jgi:uncharacterized protein
MPNEFDPRRLDVRRFADQNAELHASEELTAFPRLLGESLQPALPRHVDWQANGELRDPMHVEPQVWLHLDARTTMSLQCQRCLMPVDLALHVHRSFRFVNDEATAAAQDDASEEDLLALSRQFDLSELIEDELLMDLPVAPRHEICPIAVKMSAADADFNAEEEEEQHPFAVLGRLKGGK